MRSTENENVKILCVYIFYSDKNIACCFPVYCQAEYGGETGTCLRCGDDKYKEKADFGSCMNCTGELTSTPSNRTLCTESK